MSPNAYTSQSAVWFAIEWHVYDSHLQRLLSRKRIGQCPRSRYTGTSVVWMSRSRSCSSFAIAFIESPTQGKCARALVGDSAFQLRYFKDVFEFSDRL